MSFEKYVLSQTQSSIEYLKWASSHKSLKVFFNFIFLYNNLIWDCSFICLFFNWYWFDIVLKVVETKIPDGILPKNIRNATLSDVRVFSKRRGRDLIVYQIQKTNQSWFLFKKTDNKK